MVFCYDSAIIVHLIFNEIGNNSCNDEWYCLGCGWNTKIEIWHSRIGERYLCYCCGMSGLLLDEDAPKFLNYERDHPDANESTYDFEKRMWKFGE